MGKFTIFDVKGDGHCYYRCIYNIAKSESEIAEALYINNINNEETAIQEIREYIALSLKCEKPTQNILNNLIELYKEIDDIRRYYPLLKKINKDDDFDTNCKKVIDIIENTNMMASSFEHEIIASRLKTPSYDAFIDLQLIILTKDSSENLSDLSDKWLRQLNVILPTITCSRIAILINEDNIHYKYMKYLGHIIISRTELQTYINTKMSEESSSDSD